jgi:hypothetical protein
LKELESFKVCDFNYRDALNDDFDVANICEEYNQKKCQEFFESPFKFAPSCEKSVESHNYSLLSNKDNDLYLKLKIAERNMICSTKSNGEFCNVYKEVSPIYNLTFREIPKLDDIRKQICPIPECHKYLLETFNAYYNYYLDNLSSDNYELTFLKNEIEKFTSNECIDLQNGSVSTTPTTTEIPSPTVTLSEDEILHEQCLKELEPYNICEYEMDYAYVDFGYDINEICEEYYQKNCQEFFKSPFKFAPSCEKSVENHKYSLINNNKNNIASFNLKVAKRNLICSKKDPQSTGGFCGIYKEISPMYTFRVGNTENLNSINLKICRISECHKYLLEYFKALYDDYLSYTKEDNIDVKFAKQEIDELTSNECAELRNESITTTTTNPKNQLYFQCLKELEPFEICGFDYHKLYREEINHSEICEEYYQKNCQEFYESPYKFAPSCEKTIETHNYPIINPKNKRELEFKRDIANRNFICSKKDPQSTGEFCGVYNDVTIYETYAKDNPALETIGKQTCPIPECHKYLLNYFNAYYDYFAQLYGENSYYTKFVKSEIDYFSSNECTDLQNGSSTISIDEDEQCYEELESYKTCGFDFSYIYMEDNRAFVYDGICFSYNYLKCKEFFKSPLQFVPSCKNHENLIKHKIPIIGNELAIAESNMICSMESSEISSNLCGVYREISLFSRINPKELENLDNVNNKICSMTECHKQILEYFNFYYDLYLDYYGEDNSKTIYLLNEINKLSSKECNELLKKEHLSPSPNNQGWNQDRNQDWNQDWNQSWHF